MQSFSRCQFSDGVLSHKVHARKDIEYLKSDHVLGLINVMLGSDDDIECMYFNELRLRKACS